MMPHEGHGSTAVPSTMSADRFAEWLTESFNRACFCLLASIGHRVGLFDVMRDRPPSTSSEIAGRAGLHERYVREWLAGMCTAKVVTLDARNGQHRFSLPPDHAAMLTRAAGAANLAALAQYIPLLGTVEDEVVACFRAGGGVPYEKFPRFHAVMAEDSAMSVLSHLESDIIPLIPGLWDALEHGTRVLDLGCGSGRIVNRLAQLFPRSRFEGRDLSAEAIERASAEAQALKVTNVRFVIEDLSDFHRTAVPRAYDLVTTFDAVHDQAKPLQVLRGIRRTLTADGYYLMQDIHASSNLRHNLDHPLGTLLYTVSCLHCMTVSLAQGGEGLGAMWGEERTCEYLQAAGFTSIEIHHLEHDVQNNWYVVR
jgi:2-polyprenyl-3-methyl-5-hydroxy-6-metoxy-1,4-benzoquinol methylase